MKNFYIATGGKTQGPYNLDQLRSMWKKGVINKKTRYCEEGGDKWRPLAMMEMLLEQSIDSQDNANPAFGRNVMQLVILGALLLAIVILIIRER